MRPCILLDQAIAHDYLRASLHIHMCQVPPRLFPLPQDDREALLHFEALLVLKRRRRHITCAYCSTTLIIFTSPALGQ